MSECRDALIGNGHNVGHPGDGQSSHVGQCIDAALSPRSPVPASVLAECACCILEIGVLTTTRMLPLRFVQSGRHSHSLSRVPCLACGAIRVLWLEGCTSL